MTKRINSVEIRECLSEPIQQIVEAGQADAGRNAHPSSQLTSSIGGMVLAGGGSLIKGLDKALIKETGLPVFVAPSPLLAVCMGTGKALEVLDQFKSLSAG